MQTIPTHSDIARRVRNNRILIALAVLAIVAGVWLGQALITWLNATLL